MGISGHYFARSASAAIAGALLSTLALTGIATADTAPPVAAFTNLTAGQLVSGTLDVALSITPSAGTTVQEVRFEIFGNGVVPSLTDVVTPAAGDCASTCTVHWSADTAAAESYRTGASAVAAVPDGPETVQAWVVSSAGIGHATVPVNVDNHRPSVAPTNPFSTVVPYYTGDKQISLSADALPSSTAGGGTSLSDVQLEVPDASWPLVHLVPAGDGKTWNATVDTSGIPAGDYPAAIVATDSDGVVSAGEPVHVVVDHTFTLSAPADGTVEPDWSADQLLYGYPQWADCYPSAVFERPVRVDVKLDGVLWHTAAVDPSDTSYAPPGNQPRCAVRAAGSDAQPPALPLGKHTLTYVVTDNNGVQETATRAVDVVLPLKASWPTTATTVVAGSTVRLTPTVTAPDGTSTLASWTIAFNGKTLASGTAPSVPSVSYTTPGNQLVSGPLELTVVSSAGVTTAASTSVQSEWRVGTILKASATKVARGGTVSLSASPWAYVNGSWSYLRTTDANVVYQWSYPGGPWYTGGRTFIDPVTPAPATARDRLSRTVCYRTLWTYTGPGVLYLPSTSNTACVTVK